MAASSRKIKILYWIATLLIVIGISLPALLFFNAQMAIDAIKQLGFPDYFRIELTIAKIIGGFTLVLPMIPPRIKEWTYVGFFIDFFSAALANWIVNGFGMAIFPLVCIVLLAASYTCWHKMRGTLTLATPY